MDKALRTKIAQWLRDRLDILDHPPAPRSGAPSDARAAARVRLCKWCNSVTINPNGQRETDALCVVIVGQTKSVHAHGMHGDLLVQDGICEKCRAEQFPETLTASQRETVPAKKARTYETERETTGPPDSLAGESGGR